MKQELIQKFNEIYGEGGELKTYFAPGRVNLSIPITTAAMYFPAL